MDDDGVRDGAPHWHAECPGSKVGAMNVGLFAADGPTDTLNGYIDSKCHRTR